jgi:hypothetical protein
LFLNELARHLWKHKILFSRVISYFFSETRTYLVRPSYLLIFIGPFEVVSHETWCMAISKTFNVTRLKHFIGSREEAYELAKKDTDQFELDRILTF